MSCSMSRLALSAARGSFLSGLRRCSALQPAAGRAPWASASASASALPALRTLSTSAQRWAGNADGELANFLIDEIAAEKKNQSTSPMTVAGFKVETDGAEIKMVKEESGEKVVIKLNVNHTVDSAVPDDGTEEAPEMKSKPNFEVDLVKGDHTLSLSCSFIMDHEQDAAEAEQQGDGEDLFAIDEVTMFKGEWNEKKYAVAGDILDGYLYDLLMNMLDERGVNRQFGEQLSEYCSAYEHAQYIKMLEDLQGFVKR